MDRQHRQLLAKQMDTWKSLPEILVINVYEDRGDILESSRRQPLCFSAASSNQVKARASDKLLVLGTRSPP